MTNPGIQDAAGNRAVVFFTTDIARYDEVSADPELFNNRAMEFYEDLVGFFSRHRLVQNIVEAEEGKRVATTGKRVNDDDPQDSAMTATVFFVVVGVPEDTLGSLLDSFHDRYFSNTQWKVLPKGATVDSSALSELLYG